MLAALLPLLTAHATLVAVKSADGGCPSSTQISAALEVRLPGLLVPPEQSGLPETLLLTMNADPASKAQSFTLTDRDLRVRLRRDLPPPASADPSECPALAETVALMVERYLQEVGYRSEPTPVAERRWDLFAGATWRPGADGLSAYEMRVGLGRGLGARGRGGLALALGMEGASDEFWAGASGRLHRFPAELRLLWRRGIGSTTLELGPFAGVQLLVLRSRTQEADATDVRLVPEVGVGAGLRIPLGKSPFLRIVAALGVAPLRYEFVTPPPDKIVAFGTERVWGKMGAEAGFSFW